MHNKRFWVCQKAEEHEVNWNMWSVLNVLKVGYYPIPDKLRVSAYGLPLLYLVFLQVY